MLALPCCRRCGSVDCGDEGDGGAFATGSGEPSLASSVAEPGGGGAEHVRYGLGGLRLQLLATPRWGSTATQGH